MSTDQKKVDKKQFENENNEESLVKNTPVEGVNMEEDKKETGEEGDDVE